MVSANIKLILRKIRLKDKEGLIVTKDKSPYLWLLDFIKNSSNKRIWTISAIFMGVSFVLALVFSSSNIFSASGGVVTVLGLLIFVGISTPITLDEIQESINSQAATPNLIEDNGPQVIQHIARTVDEVLYSRAKQVLGLTVTASGTLVWAYGWLIEYLPWFSTINKCVN